MGLASLCRMPEFIYVMSRARKAHGDKVILDEGVTGSGAGQGVVPYLPLNELRRPTTQPTTEGN